MAKEHLMDETLSSYSMLFLENKWINHDPNSVAFIQLLSKAKTIFKNCSKEEGRGALKVINSRKARSLTERRNMKGS